MTTMVDQDLLARGRAAWDDERKDTGPATPTIFSLRKLYDRKAEEREHIRIIDEMFRMVSAGEADRVILTTPPQVGKSQEAGQWGPFWWLREHPSDRVLMISYAATLATRNARACRNFIRDYGSDFNLHLLGDHNAVADWELSTGGGMIAAGVGGSVTGRPADILIIDDPHKDRAEADSPVISEATWDFYSSTAVSRLAPGAPVILIQTRWALNDLAGRVLAQQGRVEEGGRWLVVNMPAFATGDKLKDGSYTADPLGRAMGEPLPHPRIAEGDIAALNAHWAEKRDTTILRDWFSLYMGDPIPKGSVLLDEELTNNRYDLKGAPKQIIGVGVDPSGGGRDTAGIIGGYLGEDRRLRWTHDRSGHMSSEAWSRQACLLAHEIGADRIVFESNYGGDMAELAIRTAWKALQEDDAEPVARTDLCPRIVAAHSKRGKLLRAEPIAQQIKEGNAWFGAPLPEMVKEFLTFTEGQKVSPGRLDAAVHLAYSLLPVPGAEAVVSSPASFRRGQQVVQPSSLAARRINRR